MQMVNMLERKKRMQGSVNRGRNSVVAESAQRVHLHHLIFGIHAPIASDQRVQLFHVKSGKALSLDAADVAAAPLDPHDTLFRTVERISIGDLRTGVSPPKVGDAKIAAQP